MYICIYLCVIDIITLKNMCNLGTIYYGDGHYEKAENIFLECLRRTKVCHIILSYNTSIVL
jgi:hypothetical protein